MTLCQDDCLPCCDFCIHVAHDEWAGLNGERIAGGPIGCKLHTDNEHQEIAEGCGACEDFHCFRVKQ